MTLTRILTTAGCAALLGGTAAMAQSSDMAVNPSDQTHAGHGQTTDYPVTGTADAQTAAAQAAGVDASALAPTTDQAPGTVSTALVTNGPVPDTPENRARFGGPISRGGQMTAPAGN